MGRGCLFPANGIFLNHAEEEGIPEESHFLVTEGEDVQVEGEVNKQCRMLGVSGQRCPTDRNCATEGEMLPESNPDRARASQLSTSRGEGEPSQSAVPECSSPPMALLQGPQLPVLSRKFRKLNRHLPALRPNLHSCTFNLRQENISYFLNSRQRKATWLQTRPP